MRSLLGVFVVCACVAPALHSADWVRIDSPHFEFYTTLPEEQAERNLETFEQARDFLLNIKSLSIPPEMPVIVVAFSSAAEFKPYGHRDFNPAYSTADEQRDYIVMSDLGPDRTRAAIHEYVHVLVRNSGLRVPLWLNEGLAEVYSGMKVHNGHVLIGAIADDRIRALGSSDLMHFPELFAVGHDSPEYNEQKRATVFYSESCLLAHMLTLSDAYALKFPDFLNSLAASGSEQAAFAHVYGKSLAEVERDLIAYFQQSSTAGAVYAAPERTEAAFTARPATELEVGVTLAKLTALLGHFDEAGKTLGQLSAAHPANPDIEEAQAYLAWHSGDREGALRSFALILDHGGVGWKTYWDYARLLEEARPDPPREIDALQKALELKPEFGDARFMLGRELFLTGQRAAALAALKQIKDPDSRYAGTMFLWMARAAAESGVPDEARQYVQEAKKYPLTAEESTSLDMLLSRLDRPVPKDDDDDGKRPTIRRRNAGKAKPQASSQ